MGIPLCVIYCFSPDAFNIFFLYLTFVSLINMCRVVFHLGFVLFGSLWVSWTWVAISLPILRKFSTIISSSIFSCHFLFVFFWDTYDSNVGAFNIVPEFSEVALTSFNSFFLSAPFISTILSSNSLILCTAQVILLLVPF